MFFKLSPCMKWLWSILVWLKCEKKVSGPHAGTVSEITHGSQSYEGVAGGGAQGPQGDQVMCQKHLVLVCDVQMK